MSVNEQWCICLVPNSALEKCFSEVECVQSVKVISGPRICPNCGRDTADSENVN